VHVNNASAYLKAGAWAVGFVQALFDVNEIQAGRFDLVEERAQRLLRACH
jgi:2-keto-3-deoxy-6-phosphogluconate aldolase